MWLIWFISMVTQPDSVLRKHPSASLPYHPFLFSEPEIRTDKKKKLMLENILEQFGTEVLINPTICLCLPNWRSPLAMDRIPIFKLFRSTCVLLENIFLLFRSGNTRPPFRNKPALHTHLVFTYLYFPVHSWRLPDTLRCSTRRAREFRMIRQ